MKFEINEFGFIIEGHPNSEKFPPEVVSLCDSKQLELILKAIKKTQNTIRTKQSQPKVSEGT